MEMEMEADDAQSCAMKEKEDESATGLREAEHRTKRIQQSQREQEERRRTMPNDARVREEQNSSGSTATPQYPQASAPFQRDPVPDELPLSFDNPALDPGPLSPAQATGGLTSDAQSTGEQCGVRSLPFRRIK